METSEILKNSNKVSSKNKNKSCADKLVAPMTEQNCANVAKELSMTDSGIMSGKSSDSDSNEEDSSKVKIINNIQNEDSSSSSGSTIKGSPNVKNDENSRSSTASSSSTITNSQSTSTKINDESDPISKFKFFNNKNQSDKEAIESHNLVLEDNNSRSSFTNSQSLSTKNNSQPVKSDDESNSRSSHRSSSRKSSPEKQSQSQSVKSSHDDDSRSSFSSSQSRSSKNNSQPVKSDDESNSRSSHRSSSRKSSPEKQSQSQSVKSSHDDDSRSSFSSSQSRSSKNNSQPVKSDDESNSRSSHRSSSRESSPEKQSQSQSVKSSHDDDSRSSFSSSQSRSSKNNSQPVKSDDESNSRSSHRSSSRKSSPEKLSQKSDIDLKNNKNSNQLEKEKSDENNFRSTLESPNKKDSPAKSKSKAQFSIVDTDSDDDFIVQRKKSKLKEKNSKADSDSESNAELTKTSKKSKIKNKKELIDSDSDETDKKSKKDENNEQNKNETINHQPNNKSKLIALIDSDSDSDHERSSKVKYSSDEEKNTSKLKRKKSAKKRVSSARASKEAAMREIHSETQRLIRESTLSLPYHRPKQRTLQEFLNRKKMITDLPKNLSCAEKVKMLPELISKVVEEKEKEAVLFYKSSDSEEDEKNDKPMETDQTDEKNEVQENPIIKAVAESSQNFLPVGTDSSHESVMDLKEKCLNVGVIRNLFSQDKAENIVDGPAQEKSSTEDDNNKIDDSISKDIMPESMEVDIFINNVNSEKSEELNGSKEIESKVNNIEPMGEVPLEISEDNAENIVLNMSETETAISDNINNSSNKKENMENSSEVGKKYEALSSDQDKSVHVNIDLEDPIIKLSTNSKEETILDKDLQDDFSLPPELVDEPIKKLSLKEQINAEILKRTPKIKDQPGTMIDLTVSHELKEGALKLINRFVRHNAVHKPIDNEISEVKIVRTEGTGDDISIVEEVIPYKHTLQTMTDSSKESKPGEKLKKLREDLKRKIATARNEEWKSKEEQEKEDEESVEDNDYYKDLPDEEELLDDEESGESEPEEDDILIVENRKPKCKFGDDEAEESDCDEDEQDAPENHDEESDEENEESEDDGDVNEEDEENSDQETTSKKPKKLKRIIKPFDEDSEDGESNDANLAFDNSKTDKDNLAIHSKNNEEVDDDMEGIPNYQPQDRTQACKTPLPNPNVLSMISPVAQLTALNTAITQKSASKTSNLELESDPEADPSERQEKISNLQKKLLFDDVPDTVEESEILEVCSGQFFDSQSSQMSKSKEISDSQLMDLCSGAFISQSINSKGSEIDSSLQARDENSQDIILTLDEDENEDLNNISTKTTSTVKRSDESMFSNDSKSPVKLLNFNETQKKSSEVSDSQLMGLCSGKFITQANAKVCEKDDSAIFKSPFDTEQQKIEKKNLTLQTQCQPSDVTDSQLMDICSGVFSTQSIDNKESKENGASLKISLNMEPSPINKFDAGLLTDNNESQVTESQIMNICSGEFKSQPINAVVVEKNKPQIKSSKIIKKPFKMDSWLKKNAPKPETTATKNSVETKTAEKLSDTKEIKENESLDHFQLTLDENTTSPKKQVIDIKNNGLENEEEKEESKAPWSAFKIISSSDEDEDSKTNKKSKKKKIKKKKPQMIELSDDELEEEDEKKEFSDEESEIEVEEEDEKFIDYDSDENEIVVVPKKEIKKVAANFLENEAELSESEWESDDEDEQGLDKLEFEEADAEDIDEEKMKNQLDKLHMKQVLDEDQRNVKLLQEIFFDDGDLHSEGGGRERRFKWRNIDSLGLEDTDPASGETGELLDDEFDPATEIARLKMKYEQQKFLQEQESSGKDELMDEDFGESQIEKMGMKVISVRSTNKQGEEKKLTSINTSTSKNISAGNITTITSKSYARSSFSLNNMKGSFLSRGEQSLIRIEQTLGKTKEKINMGRKGNFVFKTLSPTVANEHLVDSEQENDTTPAKDTASNKRKRKKFQFSQQTPTSAKKPKMETRAPGKKLF